MRLAKEVGKQQIVLAAVPLAPDPSDAVHEAKRRSLGDDQVLGPFAIELDQVDLVDTNAVTSLHYPRPLHEPYGPARSSIVRFVKRSWCLLTGP
jgi:hypothetical protein